MVWVIPVLFGIWIALALYLLPDQLILWRDLPWRPRHPRFVAWAGVVVFCALVVGHADPAMLALPTWRFLVDLAPDLFALTIAVVVLDELNQRRLEQQHKQLLFAQLNSPVRDIAVEALRQIHANQWLREALVLYQHDGSAFQWSGAQLAHADLTGIKFCGVDLTSANLAGAMLTGAELQGAQLAHANLQGAHLKGANLTGANGKEALLSQSDLGEAILVDTILEGAQLNDAHLEKAQLRGTQLFQANLQGANLTDAYLQKAFLGGANLTAATLTGADLRDTFFGKANLCRANLVGAALQGAFFGDACLADAQFTAATYADTTVWPSDFCPEAGGLIKVVFDHDAGTWLPAAAPAPRKPHR